MLTVTQAWKDAISRNGAQPCLLVTIDLDGGVTTHNFVMADTPLLTYPNLVVKAGPVGGRLDPKTRKVTVSEWSIGFADEGTGGAIRTLASGVRLFGKAISVKLGTPDLTSESDWADLWTGFIYEIEPEEGMVTLRCKDLIGIARTDPHSAAATNQHPLQVIKEILEDSQVGSAKLDTTSFDPDTYASGTYPMSHWNVGRGMHGEFDRVGTEHIDNLQLINELAELMFGSLYVGEDGKIRFTVFDPAAAVVDDWTSDDIGEFKQLIAYGTNIANRAEVSFGWKGESSNDQTKNIQTDGTAPNLASGVVSEYLYSHMEEDTDSQTNWAYPGQTKRVLKDKRESKWIGIESNTSAELDAATGAGGTYDLVDGWVSSFCGMPRRDNGTLDGTSDYGLSTTRTAYHLFIADDRNAIEVVECDLCTEGTDHVLISEYEEYGAFGGMLGGLAADLDTLLGDLNMTPKLSDSRQQGTFRIKNRGALGTSAQTWSADTRVVDITIAVAMARRIIDRYSDGVAEVEVTTNLSKHFVQIGDLVTAPCDLFLTYGKDGSSSSDNWEVTGKEVLLTDDVPRIKWRLAHVRPAPSPTRSWKDRIGPLKTDAFTGAIAGSEGNESLFDPFVNEGLTATVSGLDVTILAGRITGPAGPCLLTPGVARTMVASKDHYVYYDAMRHALTMRTVATGAAAPTPTRWMHGVTKAVAGAASATLTDRRPVRGLKGGTFKEDAVGPTNTDKRTTRSRFDLMPNFDFGALADGDTHTLPANPPDGWSMETGTWGTDATVTLPSRGLVGDGSLVLSNTAVATKMAGPVFPVEASRLYRFSSTWKGTTTSAVATVKVEWFQNYAQDASAFTPTNAIVSAKSPDAADTYEVTPSHFAAPSDARYARITVEKSAATVAVTFSHTLVELAPSMFHVHKGGTDQTGVGTAETLITWSGTEYNHGGDFDAATELFTAPRTGKYEFGFGAVFLSCADGTIAVAYLKKDPVGAGASANYKSGSRPHASHTGNIASGLTIQCELTAGDTIGVYAQTTGAARTVHGAESSTFFWGRELTP